MKILGEFFLKNLYLFFFHSNYRKFFWLSLRFIFKRRHSPFRTVLFGRGFKGLDYLSFLWQYFEIFCLDSYQFEQKQENPVIIDCGSNIGLSLLYYHRNYSGATILAFEPSSTVFEYLQKNCERYGINAELKNEAIWIKDGEISFNDKGADFGAIGPSELTVKAGRLKDYLLHFKTVDFLKIDIEGAEVAVLEDVNEALKRVESIFIEYHSFASGNQELDKVLAILTENGFRYSIQVPNPKPSPLRRIRTTTEGMDFQANIWGKRI